MRFATLCFCNIKKKKKNVRCDQVKWVRVGEIQFSFFWLIVYTVSQATFTTRSTLKLFNLFQRYGQLQVWNFEIGMQVLILKMWIDWGFDSLFNELKCAMSTDIDRRSQNSYTAPCNGVVGHGAGIKMAQVWDLWPISVAVSSESWVPNVHC